MGDRRDPLGQVPRGADDDGRQGSEVVGCGHVPVEASYHRGC